MSLKRAIETYEDWHAKPARRVIPLRCTFAPRYGFAGLAGEIIYRSAKWNADGRAENYHHKWNESGTRATKCWTPGGGVLGVRGKAVTFLGYLLAYNYTRGDGREVTREFAARSAPILAAIGTSRICLIPRSGGGVIPVVWTGLRVTSRGLTNVAV